MWVTRNEMTQEREYLFVQKRLRETLSKKRSMTIQEKAEREENNLSQVQEETKLQQQEQQRQHRQQQIKSRTTST
eukprot:689639-Amphidinium_carterae.1